MRNVCYTQGFICSSSAHTMAGFWEILSKNCGMNFGSFGCIFISFLEIFASNVNKTFDCLLNSGIFGNEAKLKLQGLNFKLEFWNKNSKNWP